MKANILINEKLKGNIGIRGDGLWEVRVPFGERYCSGGYTGKELYFSASKLDNVIQDLADYYKTSDIQVLFHTVPLT